MISTDKYYFFSRRVFAWALYDWANSAFATTVMAGFFPVFFKQYWSANTSPEQSTAYLGLTNSAASLVLVLIAPLVGAICDRGGYNKTFLALFATIGITATSSLAFLERGAWQLAALLYALASVGFFAGNSVYDSLLKSVSPAGKENSVSSFGFSLGYLGGGLLLALNILMVSKPGLFGIENSAKAVQISFLLVGSWWAIFSLPLFAFTPSPQADRRQSFLQNVCGSISQIKQTTRSLRQHRNLFLFILAYFFYIDGVHTIVKMSVDYGLNLGLAPTALIQALLLVQFIGFPAALICNFLSVRFGTQKVLGGIIIIYAFATIAATQMLTEMHFYLLASAIATVQGGAQALSRGAFAQMIPKESAGEWFGFFNMIGKFSTVLGPLLIALAVPLVGLRWSILVVLVLFVLGWILLSKVQFQISTELNGADRTSQ